ncbi:MAG: ABC transporter substrate-binding protein, partial [Fervidobacterium sp.]|nr:ABC transporter substrate-binding protein [Fervidobacterium sp.]
MKKVLIWSGIIALFIIAAMLVLYFSGRSVYTKFVASIAELVEKSTKASKDFVSMSSLEAYEKLFEMRFSDLSNYAVFNLDFKKPVILGNDEATTLILSVNKDGEYAV